MKTHNSIYRSLTTVAIAILVLLSIPLAVMQFTGEVKWSAADFIVMGALLFGAGSFYIFFTRRNNNLIYRIAAALAVFTTLLLIWANLAVGLIGSGPNTGNLLYIGVAAVAVGGSVLSRFTTKGLAQSMFGTVISLVLLTFIVLLAGMQYRTDSSLQEILAVNGFFCALFALAGILFRISGKNSTSN